MVIDSDRQETMDFPLGDLKLYEGALLTVCYFPMASISQQPELRIHTIQADSFLWCVSTHWPALPLFRNLRLPFSPFASRPTL